MYTRLNVRYECADGRNGVNENSFPPIRARKSEYLSVLAVYSYRGWGYTITINRKHYLLSGIQQRKDGDRHEKESRNHRNRNSGSRRRVLRIVTCNRMDLKGGPL